jgi:acyl-CoA thioester hydrolase
MTQDMDGYPVVLSVDVAWGEMDSFGHVNNIVFFRYFESARMAFLREIGFDDPALNSGIGPILASTQCVFRKPLKYPDTVLVGARTAEVGDDRFTMEYRIVSNARADVAATGSGVIVAFDYGANTKAALPDAVRERIGRIGAMKGETS